MREMIAQKFGENSIVQGEGILQGFTLNVANLFSD